MKFNICASGLSGYFQEYANAVKLSLEEIGHTVDDVSVGKNPTPYKPNEVVIVIMGKGFKHKFPKDTINILLFTEQWMNIEKYEKFCVGYDHIFDNFKSVQERRNTIFCPIGWSPAFETDIPHKNIHNYFLFGSGNPPHRKKWIAKYKNEILYFYHGCFGRERDKNIVESKINLMISGAKNWIFPTLHFILVVSKGKFLACDPHVDYYPYVPGKHVFVFDEFKECKKWLKDNEARKDFERKAYEDIKKNHSFTYYLGRALEETKIK